MAERDRKKKKEKIKKRNIDMSEHGYRLRSLGISERALRVVTRGLIVAALLFVVIYWVIKALK